MCKTDTLPIELEPHTYRSPDSNRDRPVPKTGASAIGLERHCRQDAPAGAFKRARRRPPDRRVPALPDAQESNLEPVALHATALHVELTPVRVGRLGAEPRIGRTPLSLG